MSETSAPSGEATPPAATPPTMEMPRWLDTLGGLIDRTRGFWLKLGDLETNAHKDQLDAIPIDRPIYIAGLARSGSTILLELMAEHEATGTHRYRDFPPLFTPIFWNRAFGRIYAPDTPPMERAHKDRILVTPDSPEALEEVLWMHFFPHAHDEKHSDVLGRDTENAAFERFYRQHLKKILFLRQASRYLSKGNYNLTRLGYLAKLFPDARFVVPVRDPLWHIASLRKQHRLFRAEESRDPRILAHMRRVGHYEFGLDRRIVHLGDEESARAIRADWGGNEVEGPDEVRGWARLWAELYGFVTEQLEGDEDLRERTMIVRYEELCDRPERTLEAVFAHVGLPLEPAALEAMAPRLSRPGYYKAEFTPDEQAVIRETTLSTMRRLGYPV